MASFTVWNWIAYGSLGLAALGIAIEGIVRRFPTVSNAVHRSTLGTVLSFGPLVLVCISAIAFLASLGEEPAHVTQTIDSTERVRQESDHTFRDDVLRFIDLSVDPAAEAMQDVVGEVLELERDQLAARAFRIFGDRQRNTLSRATSDFRQAQVTEELVATRFCEFYREYFDGMRWISWVGERVGYSFDTDRYREWQDYNLAFVTTLRDLMLRDRRYALIREDCAVDTTMNELRRGRP